MRRTSGHVMCHNGCEKVRIESVNCTYTKIPMDTGIKTATADMSNASCLFVKVASDDGTIGYGCGYPTSLTGESKNSAMALIDELRPLLVGKDPVLIHDIYRTLAPYVSANPCVSSAISTACEDLFGKYFDQPLYRLWGQDKECIMTSITLGIADEDRLAADVGYWMDRGARCFKIKLGSDPEKNLCAVAAVREACGRDVFLRCDANGAMDVSGAARFMSEAERFGIDFLEQPVSSQKDLGKLVQTAPLRIGADETIGSHSSFPSLLNSDLFHVAVLKLNKVGGPRYLRDMATIATPYGVTCMAGCMSENALSIAASLHVALSHPNISYADLDTFMFLQYQPAKGLRFDEGMLYPSDKPGLGISVDKRVFKKRKERRKGR